MENNNTLKVIASIITLIVLCFTMCTTCGDDGDDFYGTYTCYYMGSNVKITATVKEGGDAVLTVDDSTREGEAVAAHYCCKGLKYANSIDCIWDFVHRYKGGESSTGVEVSANGKNIYLCDGYAYFSYSDFGNFQNGVPYEFEEE